MVNPYYDRLNQYVPGELADGQAVEADFGAVQTGFERVAKDMQERVTKATLINGKKLDGDVNLTPGDVGAMRSINGQKPDANGDLILNLLHGAADADIAIESTYHYDDGARLIGCDVLKPAGLEQSVYQYGLDGRLETAISTYLGWRTVTTYHYDPDGRLVGDSSLEVKL